jgi:hypothetical protein
MVNSSTSLLNLENREESLRLSGERKGVEKEVVDLAVSALLDAVEARKR